MFTIVACAQKIRIWYSVLNQLSEQDDIVIATLSHNNIVLSLQ